MSEPEWSRRAVLASLAASSIAMEFLRSAVAEAQTSLSQSGLVGEIQGPTMITDPAKWPKKLVPQRKLWVVQGDMESHVRRGWAATT